MRVKRFFAPDMRQAMRRVRDEIGSTAVIISNHRVAGGVEIVAADENDYEIAQQQANLLKEAGVQSKNPQLNKELQKTRIKIAEANRQQNSQNYDDLIKKDLHMKLNKEDDLRSILASLEQQKKQKANEAHKNFIKTSSDNSEQPNTKSTPQDDGNNELIYAMQGEIEQLKSLLNTQLAAQANLKNSTTKSPLQRKLELLGLGERLTTHLLSSMELDLPAATAWKRALARLSESIPVIGEDIIERGGMIAFVGPAGVGKTTTIGKLAARYVLKHGSSGVALVTTDTYRIAAHEQLKTFGRILDVAVRIVDENASLDVVLHSLKNKRLVLIDTAGLNVLEPHSRTQLEMLEAVTLRMKKLLVVSCGSQLRVAEQAFQAYQGLDLTGCILSKMDEAGSLGEAISLAVEKALPIAYVTDGQTIPDNIDIARKNELVSRAVITAKRAVEMDKQSLMSNTIYGTG